MFTPDYKNLENAARNLPSNRIPLYEHIISPTFMEQVTGQRFAHLLNGDLDDKREFLSAL